jgi:4-amino-4-deoxy-L-arabinose transferase-like glycosyltransferase
MNLQRHLASPAALGLAFVLLIWGFWSSPLYDLDEGAFTEATREMMASGNYVSIYLNGEPRQDKPILIYWLQATSAHLFGLNEFALRLPSVLAALAWVWALVAFGRRHVDRETGIIAGILLCLSLYIGLIARAAVADALLNLFLALTLFEIYNYYRRPGRAVHLRVFLWMGLGFLTKGPVAVLFPFLISGLFFLSYGRWRDWLAALIYWPGILLFLAIVLPWHIAVYLDSGWAFFEGFYLHHNLDRYEGAMEGHGGAWFYYVLVAPLVLMPFAAWFLGMLPRMRNALEDPLDRFAWIWFLVVLVVFSFSGTKLPHYLLYGMSGMLLLMARYREALRPAWLLVIPALVLLILFCVLPQAFAHLAGQTDRLYEKTLFQEGAVAFAGAEQWVLLAFAILGVAAGLLRIAVWQRLLLIGYVQAAAVAFVVLPNIMGVLQDGPKAAALYARAHGKSLVYYRVYQPSVSLYSRQVIRREEPRPGQWVYLRVDKLDDFMQQPSPYRKRVVFSQGVARLVAIEQGGEDRS